MTAEPPAPRRATLANVPTGSRLEVTSVAPDHADELSREGVMPGAVVRVASRTPLGGPVIVSLGRVRLALSGAVAAGVSGEMVP